MITNQFIGNINIACRYFINAGLISLRSKDRQVVTSDLPNPIGYTEMRSKADGGMRDKNTSLVTKVAYFMYSLCTHYDKLFHGALRYEEFVYCTLNNNNSIIFTFIEILGCGISSFEADSNESVHHVDGWQFNLHLPDYDGWNDVYPANTGNNIRTTE